MNPLRILAIALILAVSTAAWVALGAVLQARTLSSGRAMKAGVVTNWGAPLTQVHPVAYVLTPHSDRDRREIQPDSGSAQVRLSYEPKRRGLLWHRTYRAEFDAEYTFSNPAPITQTVYVSFTLPEHARFDQFVFALDGAGSDKIPESGTLTDSVVLAPGGAVSLRVAYQANGLDTWFYSFERTPRVRDFSLAMQTDFTDIDIPVGATSPGRRQPAGDGMALVWEYSDVLGAQPLGMAMPSKLNPGPVASRITMFAPVSLLFYFSVLVITAVVRRVDLHPMNFAFLAAGCFAFQLVFAYLVDLIPVPAAFVVAAAVSMALVVGYLYRAAGAGFAKVAAGAQFAFMVLFSVSFFFDGLTGLTITAGAVATLAILMHFTARTDWGTLFRRPRRRTAPGAGPVPPVIPTPAAD